MMIFVPFWAATVTDASAVVVPQNCATTSGSGTCARTMSCQPTTVLPCDATICCARVMKVL
jgi:hypothetical protein